MILLDASVIIDFWKSPTEALRNIFLENAFCVSGVTLAELLHGARSESDITRIQNALGDFHVLRIAEGVWEKLGRNLFALRKAGLSVPFQDVLLATLAIHHGLPLWTSDSHFPMMQPALPELELYRSSGADVPR